MKPPALRLALRPHLVGLHIFAVAAVGFSIYMGLWQLGVYDARQVSERVEMADDAVAPLVDVWQSDEPFTDAVNLRQVSLTGSYAPRQEQFWVSGKVEDGQEGFWLVAPFFVAPDSSRAALMVARGWSAEAGTLPAVPAGTRSLDVILAPSEAGDGSIDADRIAGAVRIPALINAYDYALYAGFGISVADPATGGLQPVTPPRPESSWTTGLRNLMYGIQWFIFGAFAVFMWWRMTTESVADAQAGVI